MAITHLTEKNFDSETASGLVLVDFWAQWCGPCRMQAPILDELDDRLGAAVKICKLDVDEAPIVAQHFGVMSIPTLMVLKDGELVNKAVGVHTLEQLEQMLG